MYMHLLEDEDWEVVYNEEEESCFDGDTTDSVPAAYYSAKDGLVYEWSAISRGVVPNVGSSLNDVRHDCSRLLFNSTFDPTPQSFANFQWPQGVHVFPNGTAVALVHNEFHGFADRPAYCNATAPNGSYCNLWSTGLGVSTDLRHFSVLHTPPANRVFSLPYPYTPNERTVGYGAVSSLLQGQDGAFYGLVNVVGTLLQPSGFCAFRTTNVFDPASYRGWNGSHFAVTFADPYSTPPPDPAQHICTPISSPPNATSTHPSPRRIHWTGEGMGPNTVQGKHPERPLPTSASSTSPSLPQFVMVGDGSEKEGFVAVRWSEEEDFARAVTRWGVPSHTYLQGLGRYMAYNGQFIYPTILDPASPSLGDVNFNTVTNSTPYVYVNSLRNILRHRVVFLPTPPPPKPPNIPNPPDCKAFKVTGSACADGTYLQTNKSTDGVPIFQHSTNSTLQIYRFQSFWRIGQQNVRVLYLPQNATGTRPQQNSWRVLTGPIPAPKSVQCLQ